VSPDTAPSLTGTATGSLANSEVREQERLTHWPLRAKVTVAVLAVVLLVVLGVGSTRQEADNERVTAGRPPSSTTVALPSSSSTTLVPTASEPVPLSTAPTTAPTTAAPSPAPPPTAKSDGSAGALLAQLQIVDAVVSPPGYSRDLFPTWLDLDGNGCDAREDTLIAESLVAARMNHSGCEVVSGRWLSLYDGLEITEPSDLDVDHLVPLAEAWRSGAHAWDPSRRAAFANDLAFPDHLIAVTASTNRSKSDSPPNEWRPPLEQTWCRYATAWVSVKRTWALTVTTLERDALGQMLDTC
jgi:hypothetical protein